MAEPAVFCFANGDPEPPKGWAYVALVLGPHSIGKGKVRTEIMGAVCFHGDTPEAAEEGATLHLAKMAAPKPDRKKKATAE